MLNCIAQEPPTTEKTKRAVRSIEDLFFFYPSKDGDWAPEGLDFKDVEFKSEDGTALHGWYCPCENPRAIILIAHGNAGNVSSRAEWLIYLQRVARVSVFIFDYRGYGRSAGKPSINGILQDAQAARKQLCELASVNDSEIVLMGESLGGAVVVQLAAQSAPRALILQSTFSSLKDAAAVHFSKGSWLVSKKKLNSAEAIAKYSGPLLQSHGDQDATIPIALGEKIFQAANEPKYWYTIKGAYHNNWLDKPYLDQLDLFLTRLENNDFPVSN